MHATSPVSFIAPLPFQAPPAPQPLQRKKSLPDVQAIAPKHPDAMSREEVSMLGSARREELRRMADESERLRANPLLYLVSPQVKVCIHPTRVHIMFSWSQRS